MNQHVAVSLWVAAGIVACLAVIAWDAVVSIRERRQWPF